MRGSLFALLGGTFITLQGAANSENGNGLSKWNRYICLEGLKGW